MFDYAVKRGSKCHLIPHPQRLQELSLSCFGLLVLAFGFCSSFALSFSFPLLAFALAIFSFSFLAIVGAPLVP
jgi:hypothetical protein